MDFNFLIFLIYLLIFFFFWGGENPLVNSSPPSLYILGYTTE